jgi:hypothetical protein
MRYSKKQLPCQRGDGVEPRNSFVFKEEGDGFQGKDDA